MADYWKSLPKKFCDFCKCWFTDNKASVEFHERGLRHQANVKKKLNELRKKGFTQNEEQKRYNSQIMLIESSAMSSFQKDVANNPKLAKEYSSTASVVNNLPIIPQYTSTSSSNTGGRYGDQFSDVGDESRTLVFGREKALDTISKQLEKKSKWLEAKTAEGTTYYWNRDSFDTKWEAPKSGFLSLEEQKKMNMTASGPVLVNEPSTSGVKYDPYGKWHTIEKKNYDEKMPDLQLPNQDLNEILFPVEIDKKEKKIEFKEKTLESMGKRLAPLSTSGSLFKKRKNVSEKSKNVRRREDDD